MTTPLNQASTRRTTKILAFGTVLTPLSAEQRRDLMPQEVPDTVRLHLDGVIDQWFGRPDGKGVVFLLNVTSPAEAQSLLNALPLAREQLMKFDLIELGPLFPLELLLAETN